MRKNKSLVLTSLILSLSAINSGHAESLPNFPQGFYLTGQLGDAMAHSSGANFLNIDHTGVNVAANINNQMGLAGRIGFGYALNRYLAIEAGYFFLPAATVVAHTTNLPINLNNIHASTDVSVKPIDLVAKVTIPMNRLFIYGKGGASYTILHTTQDINLNVPGFSGLALPIQEQKRFSSWQPEAGMGVGYVVNSHLTVDASFTRLFGLGEYLKHAKYAPNFDLAAIGISVYF